MSDAFLMQPDVNLNPTTGGLVVLEGMYIGTGSSNWTLNLVHNLGIPNEVVLVFINERCTDTDSINNQTPMWIRTKGLSEYFYGLNGGRTLSNTMSKSSTSVSFRFRSNHNNANGVYYDFTCLLITNIQYLIDLGNVSN